MTAVKKLAPPSKALEPFLLGVYGELNRYVCDIPTAQALSRSYIAGGALVSLVQGEEPHDYDIWFRSLDDWTAATNGLQFRPARKSKYSWSYYLPSGKEVQLVKSRLGEPAEVVGSFDFKHTHCYYEASGILVADIEYLRSKRLDFVPGNLCHPVNTLQRLCKFVRRGYSVSNQSIADLMNAIGQDYESRKDSVWLNSGGTEDADSVYTAAWGGGDQGSK